MTNISSHPKPTKSSHNSDALPPKPYTEYTIFFRLERAYILQSSGIIDEETVSSINPNHHDALEFPRPTKYQYLAMPPYWYSSSHRAVIEKKRKHRKREGRMDLKTLSKTISASWKNADRAVVEYCRKLSRAELEKYNELADGILEKRKQDADHATKDQTVADQQWNTTGRKGRRFKTIPDGTLSLRDFVVEPTMQEVSAAMPVLTPHITGRRLSDSSSHNPLPMGSLYSNNDCLPSTGRVPSGPLPEKKRKFARRVSAPPEFTVDMKPFVGLTRCGINMSGTTVDSANIIIGEDSGTQPKAAKQMRRMSSIPSIPMQGIQELKQFCRSSLTRPEDPGTPFQQELRGSFTCVPEWEKEDADTLLGILNNDFLQVESSGFFSLDANQDNGMSMGPRLLEPQINDFGDNMFGLCLRSQRWH